MVDFLEEMPAMDTIEMEELYRHFLVDDMPEDDDGDEDFEPPADEEEEGEEAGVRRRNIQARELSDLLQDAFQQSGPSAIPPGLREKVLDQLSMHFQLLVQTAVLSVKAGYFEEEQRALGMLEQLAYASCEESDHRRRTRARGNPATWWDALGDGNPAVGIPGLLPGGTLKCDIKEAGGTHCSRGKSQQTVEQLMVSRGGVIWPQLLPGDASGRIAGHGSGSPGKQAADARQACNVLPPVRPDTFSMVEDRLLCRGVHLQSVDWESIRTNMLPHKSTAVLMHRYAVLSGWVSKNRTGRRTPGAQGGATQWTLDEDWKLRNAVEVAYSCGPSPEHSFENERRVESFQARTSRTTLVPTDAVTFAEDELSDDPGDCQDGLTVAGQNVETPGMEGDGGVLTCSRVLAGKRLFEEDELSDDECSSEHGGAAVLRRTRALRDE